MSKWKPAYLLYGDDHDRLLERRAKLRQAAEAEVGGDGIEVIEGEGSTAIALAEALMAFTINVGRRFIIVDDVQRWASKQIVEDLLPALAAIDPQQTTVALVSLEEKKLVTSNELIDAVKAIGGGVLPERAIAARELPQWATNQAALLQLELPIGVAQELVAAVDGRRVRVQRELEKLALWLGSGAQVTHEHIAEAVAADVQLPIWDLIDQVAAGDRKQATATATTLLDQGESENGLVALIAARYRQIWQIATELEAGVARQDLAAGLKMAPWQKDRRIAEAQRIGAIKSGTAVSRIAATEIDLRGGLQLDNRTQLLRLIGALTA